MTTRAQKRRKLRQQKKAEKIVNKCIAKYQGEVDKICTPADNKIASIATRNHPRAIENRQRVEQIQENKERELSELNTTYLQVWRGLLKFFKENTPLANVNPNYFDNFIVWGDESKQESVDIIPAGAKLNIVK